MDPMSIPRFHMDHLTPGRAILPSAEAFHARRSRRLSEGDTVTLFDGSGHEATGTILLSSPKKVEVIIETIQFQPRPTPLLSLAVAPPKEPRQDVLIEKCTELGVATIIPLLAERAVVGVSEHRLTKWRRTTVEAAKQSGQSWLPALAPAQAPEQAILSRSPFDQILVATCAMDRIIPTPILDIFSALAKSPSVLAFIGPEGGWTTQELDLLMAANARPVTLGPNTLRIETAAITLAALFHAIQANER